MPKRKKKVRKIIAWTYGGYNQTYVEFFTNKEAAKQAFGSNLKKATLIIEE